MATAGTIALTTNLSFKPRPNRAGILAMGYVRGKSSGNIDSSDLGMNSIESVVFTPFRAVDAPGHFGQALYGSVQGRGSHNNTVHFQNLHGSFKEQAAGTAHAGTRPAGTFQASWIAYGH